VYLFDVDGTLVDSAPDICGAIQETLLRAGRTGVSDELLRSYIGRHLVDVFQDLFPGRGSDYMDALISDYRNIYPARNHCCTQLYPGVLEALQWLGGRKSTATTKGTPTTRLVLDKFGLASFFDHVQGTDGFPAKPNPDVIFAALKALGAPPDDCLFVGDSAADMEAAHRAGVKACAVTYGYGQREQLARWTPDFWISDLRELVGNQRFAGASETNRSMKLS
jgi:HAD superfamily hydrolase (TIGR01509 family)